MNVLKLSWLLDWLMVGGSKRKRKNQKVLLRMAFDAGQHKRFIYVDKENRIHIGCFLGSQEKAIARIYDSYKGQEATDYVNKVKNAFEGIEYDLGGLVKHESSIVRYAVAAQGYGLDILVKDKYWEVRLAVARQGYGLDVLVNDNNEDVRKAVAEQGYGLDILIKDARWRVRRAVAAQGYGLETLVNDSNSDVRYTAMKALQSPKQK